MIGLFATSLVDSQLLPMEWAALLSAVAAATYTIVRGLRQDNPENGWTRSEFYVTLLNDAGVILASCASLTSPKIAGIAIVISKVAYAISRTMAKMRSGSSPENV